MHMHETHQTNVGDNFDTATTVDVNTFSSTFNMALGPAFLESAPVPSPSNSSTRDSQLEPPYVGLEQSVPLCQPVTTGEVMGTICKVKNRKALGSDRIQNLTIKQLPPSAMLFLMHLFSMCPQVGYLPLPWKSAWRVMIPKPKKDHSKLSNYRPISLSLRSW